jgi:hypothetical protein
MKALLLAALCLSFGANVAAAAPSLKENMKALGGLFKQISADVNNPAKNVESAGSAGKMVAIYVPLLEQVPDSVAGLPANEREAAIAEYKRIIQQQTKDATALRDAFLANDNVGASTLLQRMNADRKDGHAKFRQ